jgi:hypothetical protein
MPPDEIVESGSSTDSSSSTTAAAPSPPEWLGNDAAKFWNAETGAVDAEKMYGSLREGQSLIGRRVGDLSLDQRRKLAETLPDEMRQTWEQEQRAKLAEDPEFLTPLQEKWKAEALPKPPEAYVLSEEHLERVDVDSPLLAPAMEFTKKYGLPQEAFNDLIDLGLRQDESIRPTVTEEMMQAEVGHDWKERGQRITNRAYSVMGNVDGKEWIETNCRTPRGFLLAEKWAKGTSEQPLPTGGNANPPAALTRQELEQKMKDPRYKTDPAYHAEITRGFQKIFPSDVI